MTPLTKILTKQWGLDLFEALTLIDWMREQCIDGLDPDKVVLEFGLDTHYSIDLY
jgi:hypothetical protein